MGPGPQGPLAGSRAFEDFSAPLIGLPVTHLWQGHGSAIILEFGRLAVGGRRGGASRHPSGEMSLMIEWSWRIEGRRSILCGSWSEQRRRERGLAVLRDSVVADATLFGRLGEIDVGFANGAHLLSFMTAEGDPVWTLFDRRDAEVRWIGVRRGLVETGAG
jgi:hypothetical protein